jgi:hypothetical protein
MLTLSDRIRAKRVARLVRAGFGRRATYKKIEVQHLAVTEEKVAWICFPGFLNINLDPADSWGAQNILPKQGSVYLLNGPLAVAGFTPFESIEAMEQLSGQVDAIISQLSGYTINVFCYSAGTYPGFYFANKYAAKKLVAIAPGARMGQGIYTNPYTKFLREKCIEAGFPDWKSYDAVIRAYNQESNLANLPSGENLLIFGSRCDYVIKNYGTKEIVALCRAAGKNPTFRNYFLFDHSSLAMWLGFKNKIGLNPYRLGSNAGEVNASLQA